MVGQLGGPKRIGADLLDNAVLRQQPQEAPQRARVGIGLPREIGRAARPGP
jgi:hypothetical protein